MPKNFNQLKAKMSPESRARAEAKTKNMIEAMALDELRAARKITQEHLAKILRVKQSSISKMEHRTDMYLSTLGDFIRAMGGKLEIRAVFADGVVKIEGFGAIEEKTEERELAHA